MGTNDTILAVEVFLALEMWRGVGMRRLVVDEVVALGMVAEVLESLERRSEGQDEAGCREQRQQTNPRR